MATFKDKMMYRKITLLNIQEHTYLTQLVDTLNGGGEENTGLMIEINIRLQRH